MRPTFIISAESTLADVRALMDSYAVEVTRGMLVYFCGPLHACEMIYSGAFDAPPKPEVIPWDWSLPRIDKSLELRLIQYEPPGENDALEGIRERTTRWPFYVHSPLVIHLAIGEDWWQYTFTPGKLYDVRSITL